jgi:4-amino-4-deoxy-L-arabinose transferase-like glycosyltransferase
MGTTVLDPASSTWKSVKLTGIDRHTYWVMPLNLLFNAAGFKVFGFSVFSMRLLSLGWGLVALGAWGAILWKLTGQPALTLGALGLIAVDYHFLMQASDGRMDVMTVALGWSGVAAYLLMRERGFPRAVLASQSLTALACFTHPNGALLVLILAATTLYFDWRRVRLSTLAIAAAPYLAGLAAWACYIARSPADFLAQFLGNASSRGPGITTPIAALQLEISHRYFDNFGLAAWSSRAGRLNAIPLGIFLAGVAVCLLTGEIRRHPGYRLAMVWTAITVVFLTWFEGLKTVYYLIYLTPLYSMLLAVAAGWIWRRRPRWRFGLAAVLLVFVALQAARTPIADSRYPRRTTYDPAVQYLRAQFHRGTLIMGSASLIFGLGPDWSILDDFRLGYDSGKRAEVVVIDAHWTDGIEMLQTLNPPLHAFVTQLLSAEYREVYNQGGYRILIRQPRG